MAASTSVSRKAAAKRAAKTRKSRAAGKKAATTRKRRTAAKKAATTRKRRTVAKTAAKTRKQRAAGKKAAATRRTRAAVTSVTASPAIAEVDQRIAIVRNNLRELTEQAAASSGASTEELMSSRIAQQEAQLRTLTKRRAELVRRGS
jgi:hypothetical protein